MGPAIADMRRAGVGRRAPLSQRRRGAAAAELAALVAAGKVAAAAAEEGDDAVAAAGVDGAPEAELESGGDTNFVLAAPSVTEGA